MVKFEFEELEADDLRREQKIKKFSKEMVKLETDDLKLEQIRFPQEESQLSSTRLSLSFYLSLAPIRTLLPTFRAGLPVQSAVTQPKSHDLRRVKLTNQTNYHSVCACVCMHMCARSGFQHHLLPLFYS